MATLPVLPAGFVAIYGIGTTGTMPSGIVIEPPLRYGTVYNIWDGGATYIYGGDVVFFKEDENYTRLATDGGRYTLIQARLVTKDSPAIP